jgi:hypothetical protein
MLTAEWRASCKPISVSFAASHAARALRITLVRKNGPARINREALLLTMIAARANWT